MTPAASDIDFARGPRRLQISGWPLLAAAIVAATAVASWGMQASRENKALDAQLMALRERGGPARPAARAEAVVEAELRAAGEALDRIGIPWDRLFAAVEGATMEGIHLLGLLPDAKAGTVQIRAETSDPERMFEYANRLAAQPTLSGVYLVEHQAVATGGARTLQFVIRASWLGRTP